MSIFKLPLSICSKIQKMVAKYWWSSSDPAKALHWSKWSLLCKPKFAGGLGFRKLMEFNQALLAKQSWRIIQYPDLLMSKVLKTRYFPNSEFNVSKLGYNPSYVWRSILWGKLVIDAGSRWRIDDRKKALIYKSNWMPRPDSFRPFSPRLLDQDAVVADLMTEDQRWNKDLLLAMFLKDDAEEILKISLPRDPQTDTMIWHFEKRGVYSVKSGYQISLRINDPSPPPSSSSSEINWAKVWSLDIPLKIRVFVWKAINNFLPTGLNLHRRMIRPDPKCISCGAACEDRIHVFIRCPAAEKIWSLVVSYLPWITSVLVAGGSPRRDFASLIWDLLDGTNKNQSSLVVAVLWFLWCARNKKIFQSNILKPDSIMRKALLMSPLQPSLVGSNAIFEWKPPERDWLKINVDAAVNVGNGRAGIGCFTRNYKGSCEAALHKNILFDGNVESAEALAILKGLKLGLSINAGKIIIESNVLNVVDLCLGKYSSEKEIVWTINEIRSLISNNLDVKVIYVPRSENSSAHLLAKLGLKYLEPKFWLDEMPNFLNSSL